MLHEDLPQLPAESYTRKEVIRKIKSISSGITLTGALFSMLAAKYETHEEISLRLENISMGLFLISSEMDNVILLI